MMTVRELVERLQEHDPEAVVMLECADDYYSGPIEPGDLEAGTAAHLGPFEWKTLPEDARGRPAPSVVQTYRGGWVVVDEDGKTDPRAAVLERRPCLIIHVE